MPDGRWRGARDLGWHNGKRRRKYVTRKTRAEANKALRALTAQAESGTLSTNRLPTVAQWMEIYFREVASAKVRSSTLHRYREEVEHHISPLLGRIRIDKLAPGHLTAFYHDRLTVLAPGSVRRLHANLRRALNVAVRWQLIHANPVLMVDPPSIPHSEVRPYSLSEAREFLQSIRGHRLEARWVVGIALGLRQGVVLGLYWEDVDFEHGLIRVLERANLRRIRVHDLRHTAASVLLAQGVPVRVVMEILGYSQISVTLNTYAHVAPEGSREAATRLDKALWGDG